MVHAQKCIFIQKWTKYVGKCFPWLILNGINDMNYTYELFKASVFC